MAFSAEPASGEEKAEAEEESRPTTAAASGGAGDGDGSEVSHEEWRRWGTSSPLPAAVAAVIRELLEMEAAAGEKMRFGGVGSKLKVTPSSSLFVLLKPSFFLGGCGVGGLKLLCEQCRSGTPGSATGFVV